MKSAMAKQTVNTAWDTEGLEFYLTLLPSPKSHCTTQWHTYPVLWIFSRKLKKNVLISKVPPPPEVPTMCQWHPHHITLHPLKNVSRNLPLKTHLWDEQSKASFSHHWHVAWNQGSPPATLRSSEVIFICLPNYSLEKINSIRMHLCTRMSLSVSWEGHSHVLGKVATDVGWFSVFLTENLLFA